MSHESIVYGFIAGATFRGEDYRKYQKENLSIIGTLSDDEWPFLSASMFSAPDIDSPRKGTFRAHVLHFGGSFNGLQFDEVPLWITKFEKLLSRLFWFEATAHILTDYIDGAYRFQWKIHNELLDTYHAGSPQPTTRWIRNDEHVDRQLLPNR
jgi:hypothetical protein